MYGVSQFGNEDSSQLNRSQLDFEGGPLKLRTTNEKQVASFVLRIKGTWLSKEITLIHFLF
jgi:hypothetical protein